MYLHFVLYGMFQMDTHSFVGIYKEHSVCISPFQGPECTEEAVIDDWRVTICKTEDRNDSQNKVRLLCLLTFVVNI